MRIKFIMLAMILIVSLNAFGGEPDMIVTQDGKSLMVYNIDIATDNIYYALSEDINAPINRLPKKDVLIIKKADGTKIDLGNNNQIPSVQVPEKECNQYTRPTIVFKSHENEFHPLNKKKNSSDLIIMASDDHNPSVCFRLLSENDKSVAVTKYPKNTKERDFAKSNKVSCVIPDYVDVDNKRYTVVSIDDDAFGDLFVVPWSGDPPFGCWFSEISLPKTLKSIGAKAFRWCVYLSQIIIPDGVERIGERAFEKAFNVKEIYVPSSVTYIGSDAFKNVGLKCSPKGRYQGYLSSIPLWITTGNCADFGIDDSAVETYERRKSKN